VKTSLFGIDLRAEAIVSYAKGSALLVSWIGNAYWEQPDVRFHIIAEIMHNAESGQPYVNETEPGYQSSDAFACLAGFREVFGTKFDVGIEWKHVFIDNSGYIVPGVVYKPIDHMAITLGAPFYYGPVSGEIMNLSPDPEKRRTALGVKVDISGEF
jgi:hypothetical protein